MRIEIEVESFAAEHWLRDWRQRVRGRRTGLTRELAEQALQHLLQDHPVETGRARAAWEQAGLELGLNVVGQGGGNDAEAIAEGQSAGSGTQQEEEARSLYELQNRVKYVPILEYGSRKMQARALARRALRQTQAEAGKLLRRFLRDA